jgi:hypothetical protein
VTPEPRIGGLGRVDEAVFDVLHQHLGDEEILEFTYITMMYMMHAVISVALNLEHDDRRSDIAPSRKPVASSTTRL